MLTTVMKRAGIVISAFWTALGGYYIYLQHSHQDHWDTIRQICALSSRESCLRYRAEASEKFPPDWITIILQISIGLILIWAVIYAVAWIRRGADED